MADSAANSLVYKLLGTRGQQLLRTSTDGLKNLLARHSQGTFIAAAVGIGAAVYVTNKLAKDDVKKEEAAPVRPASTSKKAAVDGVFFQRIKHLLAIIVPNIHTVEALYVALLTILLLARTVLSISVSEVMGINASALVEMDLPKFVRGVLSLGLIAIPASVVNSLLKFFTSMLSIRFRKRLSRYIHDKYMEDITFYKASSESSIDNIDQRITQDIEAFCTNLSAMYTTTFKPVVDIVLFTRKLSSSVGWQGPIMMYLYYLLSGFFLRRLLPNFARMTSKSQQLEGNFRFHHSRLLMHAEEIAFYRGWDRERFLVNQAFDRLYNHSSTLFWKQALVGVFDAWLVKYGATMVGYAVVSLPVFGGWGAAPVDNSGLTTAQITKGYIRNTQVLINLAQATGQLVLLYKRITQLAGYTSRVGELLELFGKVRTDIDSTSKNISPVDDKIEFDHVDISTPDGELLLVKDMSMKVVPGRHTLIMGANGSGKSSIFRALARLWPIQAGRIFKPLAGVFAIPQRPYFPLGSLREQVIYPDEISDMRRKGITDADLLKILQDAELAYVVNREGGWDNVKDWVDVLSGGEKQRMGIARIFYHKPKFALIDEATSAVSVDVEGRLYQHCEDLGVTLITISHRSQLKKYHNHILQFGEDDNSHHTTFGPIQN